MTHVVTGNCDLCRFTECVTTCPVDCFHGDGDRLYINPDVCIDCGACIPACPVEAIADQMDLAAADKRWVQINRVQSLELPVIATAETPLTTAEQRRAELGFGG